MTQGETFNTPDALVGLTAYDRTGEKIGSIERVYLDDATGRADWVTVKTGLFGMKESFVPLAGASRGGDDSLKVAYTKEAVKDAPRVDADQHLDQAEKQELYAHYGLQGPAATPTGDTGRMGTRGAAGAGTAAGMGMGMSGETQHGRHAGAGAREPAMRSGAGTDGKDEMIRSEERLRVGTEEQEVGQAHLRKVVETENVTTSVPISHEEVRVVREPIREGDAKGANIGEAETEVTLHAERAVVSKETIPVERVRLETEKVTETDEVSGTVRKEKIEYDTPEADRKGMPREGKGMPRDGKSGPGHGPRH
ncbi:PRC and DUF2382 domain-containing protein [Streptomyces kunmingensis]|uniref:PRC and DUF2382 domain-containing protein n=1 Tax=Streptomyces kunmingensis TaxID=68225 RepID=A0ABU6CDF9_9ACTN|nr:PRC and DUF2382 domain-containing protein [Streptomyces kunmingensis]MEB3962753.1 PRC and DUF2382 domain-containing protein [Streptomyces kunmingensis]